MATSPRRWRGRREGASQDRTQVTAIRGAARPWVLVVYDTVVFPVAVFGLFAASAGYLWIESEIGMGGAFSLGAASLLVLFARTRCTRELVVIAAIIAPWVAAAWTRFGAARLEQTTPLFAGLIVWTALGTVLLAGPVTAWRRRNRTTLRPFLEEALALEPVSARSRDVDHAPVEKVFE